MDDHSTLPSVLAAETIPVPLTMHSQLGPEPRTPYRGSWLWTVLKVGGLALLLWIISRRW